MRRASEEQDEKFTFALIYPRRYQHVGFSTSDAA